jgi:general stress protein 26
MPDLSHRTKVAELSAKIKPIRFAMFTYIDAQGHLVSKPMTTQDIDADGALWFFTSTLSDLWKKIPANEDVNVSFAEPKDSVYVSISGVAERVVERAKIESLWNPLVAAWFPNGVEDPHLVLVKVVPHTVEYWDSNSDQMVGLLKMAKAALSGSTPEVEPGEHGKIEM